MTEIDEIWKSEAIERMADNDRVISILKERVAVLEFHLEKFRCVVFDAYIKTSGVVPTIFENEEKPKKARKKKNATP